MLNIKWQTLSLYLNLIFAEYFHSFVLCLGLFWIKGKLKFSIVGDSPDVSREP